MSKVLTIQVWRAALRHLRYVIVVACIGLLASPLHSAELVMIEAAGCVFCAKFNAEIAPAYAKTAEGKRAPLRRIDLAEPWPNDLSHIKPETLTPTFILIDNNVEIDRLHGYQSNEFFWFLLGEMLEKLEPATGEKKP